MVARLTASYFDRAKFARVADYLVVAVAVSMPWSTSATGILVAAWLIVLIPTLAWGDVRRELMTVAGGFPVLLFLFAATALAWSDATWHWRWIGLVGFLKLLAIPLLMAQFRRTAGGYRVFTGFLAACVALLIASFIVTIWPDIPKGSADIGVPVKSYILQSVEFTMCAAVLLDLAIENARIRYWTKSAALASLALAFLGNIFFIVTGRTALVIIAALILLYGFRHSGWKGILGASAIGLILAITVLTTSPYLRDRVTGIYTETERYEQQGQESSSGQRIDLWTKSIRIIESAPLFGHGTGSIVDQFQRAAAGLTGVRGEGSTNPHNQTFAVGIQIGLLGVALLWAMWISQFMLFYRTTGLLAWIGLVIVTQNIVGSLFNSFIFDFTEGWLYVFGVGVAAGMIRRQSDAGP